jgi:hypothetical protein
MLYPAVLAAARRGSNLVKGFILAIATPLLEKNAFKTAASRSFDVPMVFSMARLIVLAFAVAMLRQVWNAGIAGWPEATLSIAIVLALPILGALERARPDETLAFAKALVERFGEGATRQIGGLFALEPSKFDDHREAA